MFNRIIVGIDGSKSSLNASKFAFRLGKFYNVPVVGIYVIDVRLIEESFIADLAGVLGFTYYEGISSKVKEFLEKQGDAILTEFSSMGREMGAKVSVVQTTGIPYKEISSQADSEDLILIGRHGRRPIKGVLIGSNAEKVVRHANCPVLILPEEERDINKALVAYDGSENARLALRIAKSLKSLMSYEISVINVSDDKDTAKVLKKEVEDAIGEDFKWYHTGGFPEERIIEVCKREGIDLLLMGAYGKGRIKELFLGSVTSFLIHHLDIPMLLTKVSKER